MQAIIMAGGFGTRLRPLTCSLPKPMVPLLNKPIIEHNINLLKAHGLIDLIIILYYQSEIISDYFKDGKAFGVNIRYVKPDADYGTAGAVYCARDYIIDTFFIISGDVITDINLTKASAFHTKKESSATVVLTHSKYPLQFGIVLTAEDGSITRFYEKPTWSEVFSDTINTGIYILERNTLSLIPESRSDSRHDIDFSKDLFPYMLKHKLPLYGDIENGYWKDVGSLDDYITANMEALKGKVTLPFFKGLLKNGSIISKSAKISRKAEISNSVIGDKCVVGPFAKIKNSVLWDEVTVEDGSKLTDSVICSRVKIRNESDIHKNVYIGEDVRIGSNALIRSGVKIWPNKVIDSHSVVSKNIVWEDRWKDTLFTDSRITGLANIEITPEFASKIGMTFGIYTGKGFRIGASRDMDNVSRMIKGALISGLMSSGIQVIDLQTTPIPILRQELRSGKGAGGVFVRKSPFDPSKCDIIFFDSTGKDLSTHKTKSIERLYFTEDNRPVPFNEIGSVVFPERTYESYKEHFIAHINTGVINKRRFKIAINYSHGITSSIFPIILSDFNLELISLDAHLDSSKQIRSTQEFQDALQKLSHIVTSLKYDAGFLMDAGGEKIFMVDDSGKIISYDRFLSIIVNLFLNIYPSTKKIAVPIQASGEIDIIAQKYGTEIIHVKNSHFAMMSAAELKDVGMVGGTKGGVIFPEFIHSTDGMFAVMKILEMLAKSGKTLSEIDKNTPKLYMVKNNIFCTKEQKGKIMRRLVEETGEYKRQLIDGIKIFLGDREWVLGIPDSERELFHINAEAKNRLAAEQLVKEYTGKIQKYQGN